MTFEYPSANVSVEITKEDLTRLFFQDIDFLSKVNGICHFRQYDAGSYELIFYHEEDMVKFVMEYL